MIGSFGLSWHSSEEGPEEQNLPQRLQPILVGEIVVEVPGEAGTGRAEGAAEAETGPDEAEHRLLGRVQHVQPEGQRLRDLADVAWERDEFGWSPDKSVVLDLTDYLSRRGFDNEGMCARLAGSGEARWTVTAAIVFAAKVPQVHIDVNLFI